MLQRLKSPVIWIQIISIIIGVLVYFLPQFEQPIKIVSTAIVSIINVFAGLNNPTSNDKF